MKLARLFALAALCSALLAPIAPAASASKDTTLSGNTTITGPVTASGNFTVTGADSLIVSQATLSAQIRLRSTYSTTGRTWQLGSTGSTGVFNISDFGTSGNSLILSALTIQPTSGNVDFAGVVTLPALGIAGSGAPDTATNVRIAVSNSIDQSVMGRFYGASYVNQKFLNSGWNSSTYGTGGAGYMSNGMNGVFGLSIDANTRLSTQDGGDIYFGSLSANGFTSANPTFTEFATLNATAFKTPTQYWEGSELAADPAAPATNKARAYFRDNGSGKTQFVIRFPTGAIQVIATEP